MDRSKTGRRASLRFRPTCDRMEERALLSHIVAASNPAVVAILRNPAGYPAVRPNTPVLPFGSSLSTATFIDPSTRILNGQHVVLGSKTYVGPYVFLNANAGYIKIGSGANIEDNASIIANPARARGTVTGVVIGDSVSVGYNAIILGQSTIGAFGSSAKNTSIGPNALIDNATIAPGAMVGALARVGPGVTVPAGMYVLPGKNVTTNAEASDPALGKVTAITDAQKTDLETTLKRASELAAGYTNLYQGNSATGTSPGVRSSTTGVYNGNLSAVLGASAQPGPSTSSATTNINFEPKSTSPQFVGAFKPLVQVSAPYFPARVTGDVRFKTRLHTVAHQIGRQNAIRGDQGQPITFAGAPSTGQRVTINSPLGGTITVVPTPPTPVTVGHLNIGTNFVASSGAVILGGPDASYTIGDNVAVGQSAVVDASSIGSGAVIGARAYVSNSNVAAGAVIPAGAILINNQYVGQIQW